MSIVEEGGAPLNPVLIRRGGYALAIAGSVVGGAALFEHGSLLAAADIALALASVAVLAWTPELFEIRGGRARGMNPVFIVPASLVFFAGVENDFLDVYPLLIGAVAGVLLACGAGLIGWRRPGVAGPRQLMILLGLVGAALGYGAPGLVDVRFDASPAQPFRATINAMHVSHGKSTSYYLQLSPWGPRTATSEVSVSSSLYGHLNPGNEVCIGLHPGALSIPWYVVRSCPDQS